MSPVDNLLSATKACSDGYFMFPFKILFDRGFLFLAFKNGETQEEPGKPPISTAEAL